MTQSQFELRVKSLGGSEREAELIAARVWFPQWHAMPATKITKQQWMDIRTLLFDQREEDELNARIDNDHINRTHQAGYIVRNVCFARA